MYSWQRDEHRTILADRVHAFATDVTCEKSFENIRQWIRNIETHASEDVEKMILGNKCDMEDKRAVAKEVRDAALLLSPSLDCHSHRRGALCLSLSCLVCVHVRTIARISFRLPCCIFTSMRDTKSAQRGEALAAEYNIPFLETSAKNNINVEQAFTQMGKS